MTVKSLSADRLAEILEAQGLGPDEIKATVGDYAKSKYTQETTVLKASFLLMSDTFVDYGTEQHQLRFVNGDDVLHAVPVIVEALIVLLQDQNLLAQVNGDIAAMLSRGGPMNWIDYLVQFLFKIRVRNNEYPVWMVAIFELIGALASTDARTITAADFISLPPRQKVNLVMKLIEVNKRDFFDMCLLVWQALPGPIQLFIYSKIYIPGLGIMNVLNSLNGDSQSPSETPSNGGQASGGKPSSSSPSGKQGTSRTKNSAGRASGASGSSAKPSVKTA